GVPPAPTRFSPVPPAHRPPPIDRVDLFPRTTRNREPCPPGLGPLPRVRVRRFRCVQGSVGVGCWPPQESLRGAGGRVVQQCPRPARLDAGNECHPVFVVRDFEVLLLV